MMKLTIPILLTCSFAMATTHPLSMSQEGAAAKSTYDALNVQEILDKNSNPQVYYKIGKNILCLRQGMEKYFCSTKFDESGLSEKRE